MNRYAPAMLSLEARIVPWLIRSTFWRWESGDVDRRGAARSAPGNRVVLGEYKKPSLQMSRLGFPSRGADGLGSSSVSQFPQPAPPEQHQEDQSRYHENVGSRLRAHGCPGQLGGDGEGLGLNQEFLAILQS